MKLTQLAKTFTKAQTIVSTISYSINNEDKSETAIKTIDGKCEIVEEYSSSAAAAAGHLRHVEDQGGESVFNFLIN